MTERTERELRHQGRERHEGHEGMTREGSVVNGPEERAEYLDGGLIKVTCPACGVTVRAKKNSTLHTSVQWTRQAVEGCAEFAARRTRGEPTALIPGCGRLLDSINRAASIDRRDLPAAARP